MILKIHTYAGLATFVNLIIYGVVGIAALFEPPPGTPLGTPVVREMPFTIGPNLTDRQVAEQVVALLGLSLATPVQNFAIQHDAAHNLVLDFQHANGRNRVTFPEPGKLRVEVTKRPLEGYLASIHTASATFRIGDWRMRTWSLYNEFAMWALMGMTATGAYLWLSRRVKHRWAMASFAAGAALFGAMWIWTRF